MAEQQKKAKRQKKAMAGLMDHSRPKPAEKPVSLHPLEFEEAMRDLLRVKMKGAKGRGDG